MKIMLKEGICLCKEEKGCMLFVKDINEGFIVHGTSLNNMWKDLME